MEIMNLVAQIFELCILPLLVILSKYAIAWINARIEKTKTEKTTELQRKYLDMLNETIESCLTATTQTYVKSLKEQGAFDLEAQKVAFSLTFDTVKHLLTQEAEEYITQAVGDIDIYITQRIEAGVLNSK